MGLHVAIISPSRGETRRAFSRIFRRRFARVSFLQLCNRITRLYINRLSAFSSRH